MKILYLATNFNLTGGKERYDRDVIQALREGGDKLDVVRLRGRNSAQKIIFVLSAFLRALFFRPDVIFSAHISFAPMTYMIERYMGIPYIVLTAGTEVWGIKKDNIRKWILNSRLVVFMSGYTKERLSSQIDGLQERMFFLPPAIREDLFSVRARPEYLLDRHELRGSETLLTVARLRPNEEEKGYLRVIDALPKLRKEFPNIRYVIVGAVLKEFGDNTERIRAYARERGLKECVIVVGEVSDKELAGYYDLCDVFVMPSTQEGFGIVFLEALASGKPVIAGNRDGSRDAVLGGELGILIDPDDTNSIARAIMEILKRRAPKRFYDREFLRRRVFEVYGYEKFKERVVEMLRIIEHGL